MVYHRKEMETMDREALDRLKVRLLRGQLRYLRDNSPFFGRTLREAGLDPGDIRKVEDLARLPTTSREDLVLSQEIHPPFGDTLSIPPEGVFMTLRSRGLTGTPLMIPVSRSDLKRYVSRFSDPWMRALVSWGHRKDDLFHVAWPRGSGPVSGLFPPLGMGGAQSSLPPFLLTGMEHPREQITLMARLRTSALLTTQSNALVLGRTLDKMATPPGEGFRPRYLVLTGEPGLASIDGFRKELEELWSPAMAPFRAFEVASATEIGWFGFECASMCGLHVPEDLFHVEILDREGDQVAPGERGELAITPLRARAMPLVRYRLGDISSYEIERCGCGRTHMRLMGIPGRSSDLLALGGGPPVLPSDLEAVVRGVGDVEGEVLLLSRGVDPDAGTHCPGLLRFASGPGADPGEVISGVRDALEEEFGGCPALEVVPREDLPRSPEGALRLLDESRPGSDMKYRKYIQRARRHI